jgi:hypothetical protein
MLTFGQHGLALQNMLILSRHGMVWLKCYTVCVAQKSCQAHAFYDDQRFARPVAGLRRQTDASQLPSAGNRTEYGTDARSGVETWEDYLASLQSKYRSNVRNGILKPLDDAGCELVSLPDLSDEAERIHALYKMVQINADFRPFELDAGYFPALQQTAGSLLARQRHSSAW